MFRDEAFCLFVNLTLLGGLARLFVVFLDPSESILSRTVTSK